MCFNASFANKFGRAKCHLLRKMGVQRASPAQGYPFDAKPIGVAIETKHNFSNERDALQQLEVCNLA